MKANPSIRLAVIGAGPAGMLAALQAARQGARVALFDGNPTVGRKLLVTGSGRCNITNARAAAGCYACADQKALEKMLALFGPPDLLSFLESMGVLTYATSDGWYYPISESAATVADAFAAALAEAGVELHLGAQVTRFVTRGAGFDVFTENNNPSLHADRLVLAAGGKAYPNLGSRGELFPQLEKMGHTLLPLRPALAPVLAEMGAYQRLQGVRLDVLARLYEGHALLGKTSGNLIFTEWGVNGPAVMDLSHLISARPDADLRLSLNLMGENEAALRALVEHKRHSATPLKVVLQSVLPPKLAVFFIERAGLPTHGTLNQLTDRSVESLLSQVEDLSLKVKGVRGFEYCQVTAGGVPLGEVNPLTMESSHVSGLYLAGETLDVVGPCGGYNLQFAFTSGALAGRAAGQL